MTHIIGSYKKPLKSGTPLTERTDLENLSKKQLKKLKRKKKAIEETNNTETVEEKVTPVQDVPMKQAEEPVVDEMVTETPEEPYVPNHRVKIVDLGNSCFVDKQFTDEVQTRQYRAPEVIMGMKYSTPIDVWSAACVAFELATGDFLFNTKDTNVPRDEDHLALIAELVGEFPQKIKTAGKRWHHFFDKYGKFKHVPNLKFWPLESVLKDKYRMSTEDAKLFASFLLPMLVVDPQQRVTAEECLKHPFLTEQVDTTIDVSSVIDKITAIE
jgi:serine/threonine-protein kinase SRPK3